MIGHPSQPARILRCAIYTRKSTEEGLDQEFNSLDAQREAGESYVQSQGWQCLPDRFDDGGYSGATMERPALRTLLTRIEAGQIDAVVCYKIDRISRSLRDFVKLMELLEARGIALIAVTQSFNTQTSIGRLTLNMLMSFAEFERSMISERTRDKMAATRRKGKWSGGMPLLGYDVTPTGSRLTVNEEEAERVRTIFALYLENQSVLATVQELSRRGWTNKRWITRDGRPYGGSAFNKNSLWHLLNNVTYLGKVKYKDEVHQGEHPAIIDLDTWKRAQALMRHNGRLGNTPQHSTYEAFLKGLLRCRPCGCAMIAHHSAKGTRRYRYYCCIQAQKRGWHSCPTKSVPARAIEAYVVGRIGSLVKDPLVIDRLLTEVRNQTLAQQAQIESQSEALQREMMHLNAEMSEALVQSADGAAEATRRLSGLRKRLRQAERRLADLKRELAPAGTQEVTPTLTNFESVWQTLTTRQQSQLLQSLIERIEYDAGTGDIAITLKPKGLMTLMPRSVANA